VTAIRLGRGSLARLGATYPPAPRDHVIAGLFGVAARRDCPFHPMRGFGPASGGCSACGSRRSRAACATRWPACAGPSQSTRHGNPDTDSSLLL